MSRNDHHIDESGDVVTGSLAEPAEIEQHVTAIRHIIKTTLRSYAQARRDERRQSATAARDCESRLRTDAGRWANLLIANHLADVAERLMLDRAAPRLVAYVASMADEAARRTTPYLDPVDHSESLWHDASRSDGRVTSSWIGARGEGDDI